MISKRNFLKNIDTNININKILFKDIYIDKRILKNIDLGKYCIDKDLSYRTPQAQANPIWDLFEVGLLRFVFPHPRILTLHMKLLEM